jgi:hypothetical protein
LVLTFYAVLPLINVLKKQGIKIRRAENREVNEESEDDNGVEFGEDYIL